jgi:hypothetical protein
MAFWSRVTNQISELYTTKKKLAEIAVSPEVRTPSNRCAANLEKKLSLLVVVVLIGGLIGNPTVRYAGEKVHQGCCELG